MASPVILVAVLLSLQAVAANAYYGKVIGQLSTLDYQVSGTVYAVDETTVMIRGFNYNGAAPDAFLWVGTTNSPSGSGQPLYLDSSQTKLGAYNDAVLVVSMPTGNKITDFKWLSVWCRQVGVNFGDVTIPANFELPAAHDLGALAGVAHDVNADKVIILDANTLRFENLMYDGTGPDTYFWAGETQVPDENGFALTWRQGNSQIIPRAFNGETIIVKIPLPRTVYNISYVSLWCHQARVDFGHLKINGSLLNVPAVVGNDGEDYHGPLIGEFLSLAHGVAGKVYAVDQTRIMVREFSYDGTAPDAFLWVGNTDLPSPVGMPLYLDDRREKLGAYENGVIIVELVNGSKITDFKWLSVWCVEFEVDFGYVNISANLALPDKADLGPLPTLAHEVKADAVFVLDSKTFLFVNFFYDGQGPDTYFWVGNTVDPDENGYPLKWKEGDNQIIPVGRVFSGENVTARLAPDMTIFDVTYVSVWCQQAKVDFGHVKFSPQLLNIPPFLGMGEMSEYPNCAVMIDDEFQASWMISGSSIQIRLSGRVGKEQYLAFGVSGSTTRTLMDGSDVAVVWEKQDGTIGVVDYNLQSKQQCTVRGNGEWVGACEDTVFNGADNVEFVTYSNVDGIRHFTYTRQLVTGDSLDKAIPIDQEVYISWAVGSINSGGRVAKHTKAPFNDVKLNFGSASSSCPPFTTSATPPPDLPGWPKQRINNEQELRVEIGQNGGRRGYEAITGKVGWGIAWFVNGLLIPEIYVVRGVNYTFTVFGGDDPVQSASYHPFYITNDTIGGYAQQTDEEKRNAVIYAGPHTGPYCEWKAKVPGTSPDQYINFPEFKESLQLDCRDPSAEGTTFSWMPDDNTPDVVYYQCYTHRFLGWKIFVTDTAVTLEPTTLPTRPGTKVGETLPPKVTPDSGADRTVATSLATLVISLVGLLTFY
ncbi:protein Skeletor, isoforms B/C-like [Acanthaster planci]|uniref:Protein Skeletor, isoforms B/C-like n=1 Tax=Acanthaster planci TaxID=133434 RepID=A0A8B7XL61_ACAPL|nr:protein Skeletor, isoforms B/C-like [Acanthaster planci]XP_022080694.1 protein Skeletor, isoforms B/C-like [Acanthaster planci]XP_022080695.1 protein Skeletor, isoforms B/C-like [Acanthaster planci]